MSNLKEGITTLINRVFHDEIIDVVEPREWWMKYNDIGKRLEGYIVTVTYKYRGRRDYYCDIDYGMLRLISKDQALKNAKGLYKCAVERMRLDKERAAHGKSK